ANVNAFEHGRIGSDPDVVVDDHRPPRDIRTGTSFSKRRTGNGIGNTGGGRERMKISVGDGRVPPDDDIVANAQLEFTKHDGIGEVAVVADPHPSLFAERKMNA